MEDWDWDSIADSSKGGERKGKRKRRSWRSGKGDFFELKKKLKKNRDGEREAKCRNVETRGLNCSPVRKI